MGGYTFAQWLALWPAGLLHGLTSPYTWVAVLLAAVMVAATEHPASPTSTSRRPSMAIQKDAANQVTPAKPTTPPPPPPPPRRCCCSGGCKC